MSLQVFKLKELTQVDKVKLVFVCKAELVSSPSYVLEQMLNVLVIFTGFKTGLVVYDDFDHAGVSPVLLTFCFVHLDGVEDRLTDFKSKSLTCLDKLVGICINRQLF